MLAKLAKVMQLIRGVVEGILGLKQFGSRALVFSYYVMLPC